MHLVVLVDQRHSPPADQAGRPARRAGGGRQRRGRPSRLPPATAPGPRVAPRLGFRGGRRRRGRPASPAARGVGARRVHPLRGGDAGHRRRVRLRRRTRGRRPRSRVVSVRREPRRGHLPAASRRRGDALARAAGRGRTHQCPRRRPPALDAEAPGTEPAGAAAPVSGRSVRPAPHAVAPADPVVRGAVRLSRRGDPRAHLRRRRHRAVRPAALHGERRRGSTLGGLVQEARAVEGAAATARGQNRPVCHSNGSRSGGRMRGSSIILDPDQSRVRIAARLPRVRRGAP